VAVVGAIVATLGFSVSAGASTDPTTGPVQVGLYAPNALVPINPVTGQAVNTATTVTPASTSYTTWECNGSGGWVAIASDYNSWAIGECANGWTVSPAKEVTLNNSLWVGGSITGDYNNCGWIDTSGLAFNTGGTSPNNCGGTGRDSSTFIAPGMTWTEDYPNGSESGVPITNTNSCTEYGNFFPWSSSAHAIDPIRTIGPSSGRLGVRYQALNVGEYTGDTYYMVIDQDVGPDGNGNWVFVDGNKCGLELPPPGTY
jgi:hypothetical protein